MRNFFICIFWLWCHVYTSFSQALSGQGKSTDVVSIKSSIPVAKIPSTNLYTGIPYRISCSKGDVDVASFAGSSVPTLYCREYGSSATFMFQAVTPNKFILRNETSIVTLSEVNSTTRIVTIKESKYGHISHSTAISSLMTPMHVSGEGKEAKYQLKFFHPIENVSLVFEKPDLTSRKPNMHLYARLASNDGNVSAEFEEDGLAWNETLFSFDIPTSRNKLTWFMDNFTFPHLNETVAVFKQSLDNTGLYDLTSTFQMGFKFSDSYLKTNEPNLRCSQYPVSSLQSAEFVLASTGNFEINEKNDNIPRYRMHCKKWSHDIEVELTNPKITGMKIETTIPPGGRVDCIMKHWVALDEEIPFTARLVYSAHELSFSQKIEDLHPLVVLATLSSSGVNVTDAVLDEGLNRVTINVEGSITGPLLTRVENPVAKCEPFVPTD